MCIKAHSSTSRSLLDGDEVEGPCLKLAVLCSASVPVFACGLEELVEAALRRPRCTQRLLLQHEDLEKADGVLQ